MKKKKIYLKRPCKKKYHLFNTALLIKKTERAGCTAEWVEVLGPMSEGLNEEC